ncbi:type II secretion system minor pseudopilin GspI [Novosphingobium sp. KCTC 2891]|uniref:type II secretion system minor pseudopilin GspI n=1 Tax=Novosphingobium sp. KCTC 2891 TaxID=2989730 RepID=UPI0022216748|nr:type II secretion system minor pseudopilin GspI [Novosphingobium sp. KCTC 2891]MCW1382801.1 type II secretion system minor pseudopilin GspI [Novosphingobium sp. KCTC 2891]
MAGDKTGRAAGFTLLELLVALAVFAIATLALVRMEGASIGRTADLDQRLLREVTAQNMAAEILTDPAPPPVGEASGTIRNAGRLFGWTRRVAPAPDLGVLMIRLSVREITPGRRSQAVTFDFTRLPGA